MGEFRRLRTADGNSASLRGKNKVLAGAGSDQLFEKSWIKNFLTRAPYKYKIKNRVLKPSVVQQPSDGFIPQNAAIF